MTRSTGCKQARLLTLLCQFFRRQVQQNADFFERTHRCSIGTVHELIESNQLVVDYCPTLAHRGDGFTKCLFPAKFIAARDMMSMRPTYRITIAAE